MLALENNMKKLITFLFLTCLSSISYADTKADAQSGSIAGSQSGAIGFIDQSSRTSNSTVKASDLKDRAPGVFSAGVTAGGSNPCVVSIGGGLSVPGGGINFANAYNDGECNVRETLRLMGALSSSATEENQVLLREIACQSVTMWDAFERTYNVTNDPRYFCENERPENKLGFIAARTRHKAKGSTMASTTSTLSTPVVLNSGIQQDVWANLGY